MEEKISVIITIYNKEKYLRKCLDTIISQKYKNLEIILVNDGSVDASREICEEYKQKDNRIVLINSENRGLSNARNLGLEHATGSYIGFVDADDFVSINFYSYLYDIMKKYDADIVECNSVKVKEGVEYNEDLFYIPKDDKEIVCTNNIGALLRLYSDDGEEYGKTIVVWNKLYKKEIFMNNLRFIDGRSVDDEAFTYRALAKCNKYVTVNAGLYAYVLTDGSLMRRDITVRKMEETFEAYKEVIQFCKDRELYGLQEKAVRRYLKYIIEYKEKVINSSLENKEAIYEEFEKNFKEKMIEGLEIVHRIPVLSCRENYYKKLEERYKKL